MKFEHQEKAPKTRLEEVKSSMRVPPDPGTRGKNKVSMLAKNLADQWGIPVQETDETAETGDKIVVLPTREVVSES